MATFFGSKVSPSDFGAATAFAFAFALPFALALPSFGESTSSKQSPSISSSYPSSRVDFLFLKLFIMSCKVVFAFALASSTRGTRVFLISSTPDRMDTINKRVQLETDTSLKTRAACSYASARFVFVGDLHHHVKQGTACKVWISHFSTFQRCQVHDLCSTYYKG